MRRQMPNKRKHDGSGQKELTSFQLIKRLLGYAGAYKLSVFGAVASALFSVLFTLAAPVIIGRAIDFIVYPQAVDFTSVAFYLILLAVVIGLSVVFQWLLAICTNKVTYGTVKDLRHDLFAKINRLPLKEIDGSSHGDLLSRIVTDADSVTDGLLHGFTQMLSGIITVLGTLAVMLWINWRIALVVVILTPLSIVVAYFIAKGCHDMFSLQSKIRGQMSGFAEEMIGNQKVVKTLCYEPQAAQRFDAVNTVLYDCGFKAQFYSALTNPSTRFVNAVVYAVVGIFGAISVITGPLTIGQLSSFLTYANQYTKPFNEITGVVTELQTAMASAARIFKILDTDSEQSDVSGTVLSDCDGTVSLEHVYFSYSPDKKLIEDFNLAVFSGQRIAIVGPTGCGKTTLINLLMRFYDVSRGKIVLSGKDIRHLTRKSLRRQYGMVLQETWLFSGTIRENIIYGKPDATEDEMIAAAKACHAHSFIKRLAQGYQTVISDAGGNLSQGQKQLLCICRIMLTAPPMLILDEATSSIDTRTELKIQRAFNQMMQGKTSFIVAHRLSTIQEADVILVMDKGSVVEQGTHEQLLKKGGFYAKLYYSQFEAS